MTESPHVLALPRREGHKHIQTTLRYAELADETADAEVRAWRRQHN